MNHIYHCGKKVLTVRNLNQNKIKYHVPFQSLFHVSSIHFFQSVHVVEKFKHIFRIIAGPRYKKLTHNRGNKFSMREYLKIHNYFLKNCASKTPLMHYVKNRSFIMVLNVSQMRKKKPTISKVINF